MEKLEFRSEAEKEIFMQLISKKKRFVFVLNKKTVPIWKAKCRN